MAKSSNIARIRIAFAEKGYYITPVAKRFRRHAHAFVAIPKDAPTQLLVVSPISGNRLCAEPYSSLTLYTSARDIIKKAGVENLVWKRQIPPSRRNLQWQHFIPPDNIQELELLM